jgi:choline dehydrogenase-like flavoprotein
VSIRTGRTIEGDRTLRCDVCVIGSGAGGAHVAARLAEAGKSVIVLEEGGFHPSKTFDMTEGTMVPRLYQERGWRSTDDGAISILQGRAVGGTTVVNWTTCLRTPRRVFEHWEAHHGVRGPTHDALVPHWERVEERLSVDQVRLDEVNANNRVIWDGAQRLGWDAHLLHRNVSRCAHTGYCGVGCPIDAKQSMLVTMIPDAVCKGAEVYANASVERIEVDGRRVRRVVARVLDPRTEQPKGATLTVEAGVTVLAAGAINGPAILLRSDLNRNGRVGRRTFVHPATVVVGVHGRRIDPFSGAPQYVAVSQFSERDSAMGFLMEASPLFPMAAASGNFELGVEHQRLMERLPHLSAMNAILHDGFDPSDPDEGGTVSLRGEGRPQLSYRWTPRLMEALREANRRCAEIQLAGGASAVYSLHAEPVVVRSQAELHRFERASFEPCQVGVFSAHVMGGCAMGTDPDRSVVDSATLRHHELDDLFVVDGSVFPTSLGVNPQMSIYGLASWASEHIIAAAG